MNKRMLFGLIANYNCAYCSNYLTLKSLKYNNKKVKKKNNFLTARFSKKQNLEENFGEKYCK